MGTLKKMEPFLARAEELRASEPVVAYYIQIYSLISLMKAKESGEPFTPEATSKLTELFGKAEGTKKGLDLTQGRETMESYALRVFDKSDSQDRSGLRDASTKRLYYVAGQMLDVCKQFYDNELPPDLAEKAKYAKWRCMAIHEALQQGVEPPPPPDVGPGGAGDEAAALAAMGGGAAFPSALGPPLAPTAAQAFAPAAYGAPPSAPPAFARGGISRVEAQKKAEFAASALDFGDVAGGRRFLLEALHHLGG